MSLMNLGVSLIQGRLVKSAALSALALTTFAGSVMLSGGEAKACQTGTASLSVDITNGPGTCTIIDPNVGSLTNPTGTHVKEASLVGPNTLPALTNVTFELTSLQYSNSQVQIDTDFNPGPLVGPTTVVQQQYTVKDLTPHFYIDGVDLAFDGMNPVTGVQPRVVKEVFATSDFTAAPILTLTLIGPGSTPVNPLPRQSQYWFRDTFTPGDGTIDNALNTVRNVPGPLPVLGAGAAFGFSRKLRSRIKATSAA